MKLLKQKVEASGPQTKIDLIDEFSTISIRILLSCAFGEDFETLKLNFWENGKQVEKNIAAFLRDVFSTCFDRMQQPRLFLLPEL